MTAALFDVDGILADFQGPSLREIARLGGPVIDPNNQSDYSIQDLPEVAPVREGLLDLWHREGFCRSLEPYPDAPRAIAEIRELGVPVMFVTAAMHSKFWHWERVEWLVEHFGATEEDVIFAHRKHLVDGHFLVEDSPKNAVAWADAHPDRLSFLWNHSYNRNVTDLPSNVVRVSGWGQILIAARDAANRS